MEDSYLTIRESSSTEIKIKRSRFIGSALACSSKQIAEQSIADIAKKHYSANHNCFAYQIRSSGSADKFRYSDDGEPSGTAGKPIYDAIRSAQLTNIVIVVTRYFGGIKLGTGGLARAYRDSAKAVLEICKPIEILIVDRYRIQFALNFTNIILRLLSAEGIRTIENNYTDQGEIIFEVRLSKSEALREALISSTNGRVKIEKL